MDHHTKLFKITSIHLLLMALVLTHNTTIAGTIKQTGPIPSTFVVVVLVSIYLCAGHKTGNLLLCLLIAFHPSSNDDDDLEEAKQTRRWKVLRLRLIYCHKRSI